MITECFLLYCFYGIAWTKGFSITIQDTIGENMKKLSDLYICHIHPFYKSFLVFFVLMMPPLTVQAQYNGKSLGWATGYCAFSGRLIPPDYKAFTNLVNFTSWVLPGQALDTTSFYMKSPVFVDSCHRHGVKAILGIGGGGNSRNFVSACSTSSTQTNFIKNIIGFIRKYNYDGVDIDWENGTADTNVFRGFFKQLRDSINTMDPRPIFSALVMYMTSPLIAVYPYVDQLNYATFYDPVTKLDKYYVDVRKLGASKTKLGIGFGWDSDKEITDPNDILAKCRYAIDSGYGGIVAWNVTMAPTYTTWILDSISRYVNPVSPVLIPPVLMSPTNLGTNLSPNLTLTWNAAPLATTYHVQLFRNSDFITGKIVDSVLSLSSLEVKGLSPNATYYWRVCSLSNEISSSWSSPWTFTTIPATSTLSDKYELFFNVLLTTSSSIRFSIPKASTVSIRLFSIRGQLLKSICNATYNPGFNEIPLAVTQFAKGNYLLEFKAGTFCARKKIVKM